jgi:hypothetical protein
MPAKSNITEDLGQAARANLLQYRNHILLLGCVLLIYGAGMYAYRAGKPRISAWVASLPKPTFASKRADSPPAAVPVQTDPNPAPTEPVAVPAGNVATVPPDEARVYTVIVNDTLHLSDSNIKISPQSVAVNKSSTKITFLADASNTGGGNLCPVVEDHSEYNVQAAGEHFFLIDNNGKRYQLLGATWPFPDKFGQPKCERLEEGEHVNLILEFGRLDDSVTSVSVYWWGGKLPFSLHDSRDPVQPTGTINSVQRFKALGGPITVNGLQFGVESVEVTLSETKVSLKATSLSPDGNTICNFNQHGDSPYHNSDQEYVDDEQGKRHHLLWDLSTPDSITGICRNLVNGEVMPLVYVYDGPLNPAARRMMLHWMSIDRRTAIVMNVGLEAQEKQ